MDRSERKRRQQPGLTHAWPRDSIAGMRATAWGTLLAAFVAARAALACSDYEEFLAPQGVRVQFESDGDAVWMFDGEAAWVRLALTGQVRRLPSPARYSWVSDDGSVLVEVRDGPFRADCSFDWQRIDRLDLVSGERTGSPRVGGSYPSVLSASPRATRALIAWSTDSGGIVASWADLVGRRIGPRLGNPAGLPAFLGEGRVALPEGDVVRVVDVETGAERGRVVVQVEDPSTLQIAADDASEAGLTLVDRFAEEWTLVRIDLSTEPYRVSRSPWTGRAALRGISRDGGRVVTGTEDTVTVLDRASGQPIAEAGGPPFLVAAALAPDGRLLAVASRSGEVPAAPSSGGAEYWPDETVPVGPLMLEVFDLSDGRRLASHGEGTPSRVRLVGP